MPQWEYCSLYLNGNDLIGKRHEADQHTAFYIPPDVLIDQNNSANTLRRWTAAMGEGEWELVKILTPNESSQEWIFKRPISETY